MKTQGQLKGRTRAAGWQNGEGTEGGDSLIALGDSNPVGISSRQTISDPAVFSSSRFERSLPVTNR